MGRRLKRSTYLSKKTGKLEFHDSSYELERFKTLDESSLVKTWTKRHGIRIGYRSGRKRRKYIPDILVEYHDGRIILEEVKGYVFDKMNFARKNLAARLYCNLRNIEYRIIFRDDLKIVL
jgi:hypothetical protein